MTSNGGARLTGIDRAQLYERLNGKPADVLVVRAKRTFLQRFYWIEIAKGMMVTLRHLVRNTLNQSAMPTSKFPEVEHTPPRAGDIRHSQADIERARHALGYEPRVSFREGLEKTVAYFRSGAES